MNERALEVLSSSVRSAYEKYNEKFDGIFLHDTSGNKVKESNTALASKILDSLQEFLDPEILVVPKECLADLPMDQSGNFEAGAASKAAACISKSGTFVRRSQAESDDGLVQIIPAGILTYEDKVFVFQRKEPDPKYRLYGKTTILEATHTVNDDGAAPSVAVLEKALLARIARSLFLGRHFPMKPIGYCWDREDENSRRHFATVFQVDIDSEHTADGLRKKEFRRWRGPSRAGEFFSWAELKEKAEALNLEPWSLAILRSKLDQR